MAQSTRKPDERVLAREQGIPEDDTFRRNGPEPPENDSGPSPSVDERERGVQRSGRLPFADRPSS